MFGQHIYVIFRLFWFCHLNACYRLVFAVLSCEQREIDSDREKKMKKKIEISFDGFFVVH